MPIHSGVLVALARVKRSLYDIIEEQQQQQQQDNIIIMSPSSSSLSSAAASAAVTTTTSHLLYQQEQQQHMFHNQQQEEELPNPMNQQHHNLRRFYHQQHQRKLQTEHDTYDSIINKTQTTVLDTTTDTDDSIINNDGHDAHMATTELIVLIVLCVIFTLGLIACFSAWYRCYYVNKRQGEKGRKPGVKESINPRRRGRQERVSDDGDSYDDDNENSGLSGSQQELTTQGHTPAKDSLITPGEERQNTSDMFLDPDCSESSFFGRKHQLPSIYNSTTIMEEEDDDGDKRTTKTNPRPTTTIHKKEISRTAFSQPTIMHNKR